MAAKSIPTLLEDIRLLSEEGHALVQAVRALVKQTFGAVDEEVDALHRLLRRRDLPVDETGDRGVRGDRGDDRDRPGRDRF